MEGFLEMQNLFMLLQMSPKEREESRKEVCDPDLMLKCHRPFTEMCAILHKHAGTHPAQFTCSVCCSHQLYQKYIYKY